jgi:hypothetical protein
VGCDGPRFSIQDLLPGKLAVAPPPPSPTQKPKRTHNTYRPTQKPKRTHNTYRPTQERPYLEFRINEWLTLEHLADSSRSVRPPDFILTETQRAMLIRADPRKIKTAQDITVLLEESTEWGVEWAAKIFTVITQFEAEYTSISGKSTTQRKRKRM